MIITRTVWSSVDEYGGSTRLRRSTTSLRADLHAHNHTRKNKKLRSAAHHPAVHTLKESYAQSLRCDPARQSEKKVKLTVPYVGGVVMRRWDSSLPGIQLNFGLFVYPPLIQMSPSGRPPPTAGALPSHRPVSIRFFLHAEARWMQVGTFPRPRQSQNLFIRPMIGI